MFLALIAACAGPDRDKDRTPQDTASEPLLSFVAAPTILPRPDRVYLARELTLEASAPVTVEVSLDDGVQVAVRTYGAASEAHTVPLLGLHADTRYTVDVTVTDTEGHGLAAQLELTTEPLPAGLPSIEVLAHDPERVEPGYILLDVKEPAGGAAFIGILDPQLQWAWLHEPPGQWGDSRMTPDGHLWALIGGGALEMDAMGRIVRYYTALGIEGTIPLDGLLHHELFVLDDGFLSLTQVQVEVDDYPIDYTTPTTFAPATLLADAVVEIGFDGVTRNAWALHDLLDTSRIGWGSLDVVDERFDWSHANAVVADPSDDGIVVSVRHQDAVVKFSRSGSLMWILANHDGWAQPFADKLLTPVGPVQWPSHQHAPEFADDGTLVMFDNGNYTDTPYSPGPAAPQVSRSVGYRIDEQAMTVTQVFSFDRTTTGPEFSVAQGDADQLPITGNVLSTYGLLGGEGGTPNPELGFGARTIRLVEHAPGDPTPVLDVRLYSSDPTSGGWKTYRANRIPDLYGW